MYKYQVYLIFDHYFMLISIFYLGYSIIIAKILVGLFCIAVLFVDGTKKDCRLDKEQVTDRKTGQKMQ